MPSGLNKFTRCICFFFVHNFVMGDLWNCRHCSIYSSPICSLNSMRWHVVRSHTFIVVCQYSRMVFVTFSSTYYYNTACRAYATSMTSIRPSVCPSFRLSVCHVGRLSNSADLYTDATVTRLVSCLSKNVKRCTCACCAISAAYVYLS